MELNRELNLNEMEKVAGGTYDPQNSYYKFITSPSKIRKNTYLNAHVICGTPGLMVVHASGPGVYNAKEGTSWNPIDLPMHGYVLASEVAPCDPSEY